MLFLISVLSSFFFGLRYLSTQREVKLDPEEITKEEVLKRLGGVALPESLYAEGSKKLAPSVAGRFEFWGESTLFFKELVPGAVARLKTKKDSVFIESITLKHKKDFSASTNYAGENVLDVSCSTFSFNLFLSYPFRFFK